MVVEVLESIHHLREHVENFLLTHRLCLLLAHRVCLLLTHRVCSLLQMSFECAICVGGRREVEIYEKETANSSCMCIQGWLAGSPLPPSLVFLTLPPSSSPSISILHLYHQHTILFKVVIVTDDVWVVKHLKNFDLQQSKGYVISSLTQK